MKIQIQSVHFNADQKLLDFTQLKIDKLEKFDEKLTNGEVIFSLSKDNDKGNKGVVVKLNRDLVAERHAPTFEQAIDECVEALKRQIEKNRDK